MELFVLFLGKQIAEQFANSTRPSKMCIQWEHNMVTLDNFPSRDNEKKKETYTKRIQLYYVYIYKNAKLTEIECLVEVLIRLGQYFQMYVSCMKES